jgi:hypothetical protein
LPSLFFPVHGFLTSFSLEKSSSFFIKFRLRLSHLPGGNDAHHLLPLPLGPPVPVILITGWSIAGVKTGHYKGVLFSFLGVDAGFRSDSESSELAALKGGLYTT